MELLECCNSLFSSWLNAICRESWNYFVCPSIKAKDYGLNSLSIDIVGISIFYANWQREENKTTLKKIVLGIQNYFLDKLEKNLPKKSSSNNWYLASARQSKLHISICAKESSNFYTLDTKS